LIVRFETISINTLSFTKSAFGEQGVTQTLWFKTRAKIHEVGNYSITYDGDSWRIEDAKSDNSRQHVRLMCFRNDPQTAV